MSQSKPYEFQDAEEIAHQLADEKAELGKEFDERKTLDEIIRKSVEKNTFRAFHHTRNPPSSVFRDWARAELQSQNIINELIGIDSQLQYDEWLGEFSGRFSHIWQNQMGDYIPYGPSRKLPNLLLKQFVKWDELSSIQRINLLNYLHVPLDSYTLVGIRNCVSDPEIPKTPTMKFVQNEMMYNQIQKAIRDIAYKARVPAIYFDILAWDKAHPQ